MELDPTITVGKVICLWKRNDPVFGRVLAIEHWENDDILPPSCITIEDFPTIGSGISFVWPADFSNLKVIDGEGWKESKWEILDGKWVKE